MVDLDFLEFEVLSPADELTLRLDASDSILPPMEAFWCADLMSASSAQKLVVSLSGVYPLDGPLNHLKRIRASSMSTSALGAASEKNAEACPKRQRVTILTVLLRKSKGEETLALDDAIASLVTNIREVQIPSIPPGTKALCDRWKVQYWPMTFKGSNPLVMTMGRLDSESERNAMQKWCAVVSQSERDACIGIIVDPRTNAIVARAKTPRCASCIERRDAKHHACMKCVDLTAVSSQDGSDQYLCTGLDIYLAAEPCIMCAMALVHSRIRRVFYIHAWPEGGALGSVYRLHVVKSINHHPRVFRCQASKRESGRS